MELEELEGLWKFVIFIPRMGQLKVVLELETSENNIEGSICVNDQFESDLNECRWDNDTLIAHCVLEKEIISLNFLFNDDIFTGTFKKGILSFSVKGYRSDPFQSQASKLTKEVFDKNQLELEQKEIHPIKKRNPTEIHAKVNELLSKMTLDEKIGQMYQMSASGTITGPAAELEDPVQMIKTGRVGSMLGFPSAVHFYTYQKIAVEESRLKIPLMLMADVIHGLHTIMPIPIAQASSWDMDVIYQADRVAAIESAVAGINLSFAPMVDIARDPRWGRIMEGAGEDPFLGACCAAAHVKGFQGGPDKSLSDTDTIISCVKHYAAYGGAEGGRDYNTVDMSDARLRNYYLPPYKGAIDAGVGCLMSSFNVIHGQPASGNKYLLNDILRKEWGFNGMIISDYNSVVEMIAHGYCATTKDAAKAALEASLDIEMVSMAYLENGTTLVKENKNYETLIDSAVRRILYYKFELGLFDDPYRYINIQAAKQLHLCAEHRKVARDVARKSMILLKNDTNTLFNKPLLPLTPEKLTNIKNIALIGPFSDEGAILGAWGALGNSNHTITLHQGLKAGLDRLKNTGVSVPEILMSKGCDITGESTKLFEHAFQIAQKSDVIILALGEDQHMSGEAESRGYLNLPGVQDEFAKKLKALGKPIILILFSGRPLLIDWYAKNIDAILYAWFPGTEGGSAITDILLGDYNPSGKLTVSFPICEGQIPVYYNHFSTGRPQLDPKKRGGYASNYKDISNDPLYCFGHGLSYTTFEYSDISIDKTQISKSDNINIYCKLTNTGQFAGEEIVQLYIQDIVASNVRPVKELKGFQKVLLNSHESKVVHFVLKFEDLGFWNNNKGYIVEPGEFVLTIGSNSQEGLSLSFLVTDS